MRDGWTYKLFEDCLMKAAKPKQVQTSEYHTGTKYPIISQEDKMVSGYCDDSSLLYHIEKPIVIFGDHTRVLKYVDFDFVVGADGVKILIPKDFLRAKYMLYYLRWYNVPSLGYSRHYKLLKEIRLPIPPHAEQEHIVSELDLLSSIIEKKKVQLKEYDQLAQSIFYDMFGDPVTNEKGWEVKSMGELFDIGSSKRVFESQWKKEGVPFYRAREIVRFEKNEPIESPIFISEMLFQEYANNYGVPSEGDIMVTAVGTLGVCYIVKKSDRFYFKDGNILWFKSKGLCETRFIKDQYATPYVVNQIQGNANAAVVGTYTITNAKKTKVIIPPLALQNEYVKKIEAIEKQKALIQQSITETETLFNSRMDYYFN